MQKRPSWTRAEELYLFNEVSGFCPICGTSLLHDKKNSLQKIFEIAHIYPHSPTHEEVKLLINVEKLSDNAGDIKNVICLCPTCHTKYDKHKALEEYNYLLNTKKTLLDNSEIQNEFFDYKIEDEIQQILKLLADNSDVSTYIPLQYNPLTIDKKTNNTIGTITKETIKWHVSRYFTVVKQELQNIDAIKINKAEQIATQVKAFYLAAYDKNKNQEFIYNTLIEWLDHKTKISKYASAVVISFFIQNCEVFSAISE